MINIGYKFKTSGAVVLATAPADQDSIIVLCKETWGFGTSRASRGEQYITGRVYVRQLPHPEGWDNGTYDNDLEMAVRHFMDRAGMEFPEDEMPTVRALMALVRNVEEHLVAEAEAHGPVPATWFGRRWPTCLCGYDPHDNSALNKHWAQYGFKVVDHAGQLTKEPI